MLVLVGFGPPEQHAAAVDEVRASCPPLFEFVTPMPFTALQQMFDQANCWGQHYYEKSAYIAEITDDVIDVVRSLPPSEADTSLTSVILIYSPRRGVYSRSRGLCRNSHLWEAAPPALYSD